MKTLLTVWLCFAGYFLSAQVLHPVGELPVPDSLAVVPLAYQVLDSQQVAALISEYMDINNLMSFNYSKGGLHYFAFRRGNINNWLSFEVPYEDDCNISDVDRANLGTKGEEQWIIKGECRNYGGGGGTGTKWLIMVNIDTVPKRVLKIIYGCFEESFGDRQNEGEGRYYIENARRVAVIEDAIAIGIIDREDPAFDNCELTNLPSGFYTLQSGRMVKEP